MTSRQRRNALAAVGAAGVLTVGLVVPALAQDDTSTTDDTTAEESVTDFADLRAARDAELAAALAEELGLDQTTVANALTTVREELRAERQAERLAELEERLAEAVAAGDLTQEQADALLAAHEAGVVGGFGRFGGRGGHHGHGMRGALPFTSSETETGTAA